MSMKRKCLECSEVACRLRFGTLLQSVRCEKCFSVFEYTGGTKFLLSFFTGMLFISIVFTWSKTENLYLAITIVGAFYLLIIYLLAMTGGVKLGGAKAVVNRLKQRRKALNDKSS